MKRKCEAASVVTPNPSDTEEELDTATAPPPEKRMFAVCAFAAADKLQDDADAAINLSITPPPEESRTAGLLENPGLLERINEVASEIYPNGPMQRESVIMRANRDGYTSKSDLDATALPRAEEPQ